MMKKVIRGLWALALCFCLGLGMTVSASAASASPSLWAAEDVQNSINAGIVPAALRSNYTAPITRAQFCAIAAAVYEKVTGTEITGRTPRSRQYCSMAVRAASSSPSGPGTG